MTALPERPVPYSLTLKAEAELAMREPESGCLLPAPALHALADWSVLLDAPEPEAGTMTHQCPGPSCDVQVDPSRLMCPGHWAQVPKPIQAAVRRAWDRGAGDGTLAHRAAVRLAVAAVRREVIPASSLKHPACGPAVGSQPQAGPFSSPQQGPGGPHR